ncbi:hypothetical protein RHMOL_Rhmol11G0064600 [Rhododendron molle]|uniref:Uncharacterized protein n=1 Tax=Rhododendron molle TaxID=49168 RepID=A0ACC0LQ37_RHOML|nr:hypothetical protein RHMOL_Rhmol11G0064600 [Rhododendron molle]
MAVKRINEGNSVGYPDKANQCADHLARIGSEHGEDLVVRAAQPLSFREFWIRNRLNIR